MPKIAFSTVACPSWTLERVAAAAAEWGFDAVELRSYGHRDSDFACDPGLTDPEKVRDIFAEAGVEIAGLASGVRFDAPIFPPVVGLLLPSVEASVREGRHMVQVAHETAAPYVRVFAFEIPRRESRRSALRRICDRLAKVCDYARGREVTVLIENGGGFPTSSDLLEIMSRVDSPFLAASYDIATAVAGGEDPVAGARALGARLRCGRLRDLRGAQPVPLGQGELPCRAFAQAVAQGSAEAVLVCTWDRAWMSELAPAEKVLPGAARLLHEWTRTGTITAAA